ncbi:hypothetical protein V492_02939, partial [Pseudogymnoascus sp. VKM F-4246]
VPGDTPAGPAVFAWTWFNKVGNREMYMNCASVTITAGSGATKAAFSKLPAMFVANAGNGCTTVESSDLDFPEPGLEVTKKSSGTAAPVGTCASGSGSGTVSNSDSGSGSGKASTGAATSASPVDVVPAAPSSSNTGQQAGSTTPKTPTGPLTASTNGECGGTQTCTGSAFGQCCSKYGYCGVSAEHCGDGCDPKMGTCGAGSSSTGAAGAAKPTANSLLVSSNVADTKADVGQNKVVKTETKVVYSTVYITDGATATGEAKVNDVGGRSTFQTVTRPETVPRSRITVIPVVPE